MAEREKLKRMVNAPQTITLSGEEFKVKVPSICDLEEAQEYSNSVKKKKRRESLQERLELNALCPSDMNPQEKKELLDSYLPKEITPQERIDLLNNLPSTLSEAEKIKRLSVILVEKNNNEWSEVLYLLWLCIRKCQPEVTFDKIKQATSIQDLEEVIEVLNPSTGKNNVEGVEKNS